MIRKSLLERDTAWYVLTLLEVNEISRSKAREALLEIADGREPDLPVTKCLDAPELVTNSQSGESKPNKKSLSKEARQAREPPPPWDLVDALQDRCHIDPGRGRPARPPERVKRKIDKAETRIAQLRGAINNVLSTATGNQWRDVLHEALRRDDERRLGDE